MPLTRRDVLLAGLAGLAVGRSSPSAAAEPEPPQTLGVVLYPWDLSWSKWPEVAAAAGLTTIALHAAVRLDVLVRFVQSDAGQKFLSDCRRLGLAVEYELHAMGDLLSREFIQLDKTLFRVDATGQRNRDFNLCPSSPRALEIVAEQAVHYARLLAPTTGRYFYWPDDGREWCHCDKCKGLSASDQATIVENAMVVALRKHIDPKAILCHISYHYTLPPPKQVTPHPGLFLEFAPISRSYKASIADRMVSLPQGDPYPTTHGGYLDLLDENLKLFPKESAQVLEYWLDVSLFSGWNKPAIKLPWEPAVMQADVAEYRQRGIRHFTSFATYIDAEYVAAYGEPPLKAYGSLLKGE